MPRKASSSSAPRSARKKPARSPAERKEEEEEQEEEHTAGEVHRTVKQLRDALRERGLAATGKKADLLARLQESESQVQIPAALHSPPSPIRGPRGATTSAVLDPVTPAAFSVATTAPLASSSNPAGVPDSTMPLMPPAVQTPSVANLNPAPQPQIERLPGGLVVVHSPLPRKDADERSLRVRYGGGGAPVDTIRFDVNDALACENVASVLRSLFPGKKVDLDPHLDAEPIYLTDEFSEIHILTLGFLRACPKANDPPNPPTVYAVCRGTLPTALTPALLDRYILQLALAATLVELVLALAVFGPRNILGQLPRTGTLELFLTLHDWLGFGLPASFVCAAAHLASWFVACAYVSPAFRFPLKYWFPRLAALRVDAAKEWRSLSTELSIRRQRLTTRVTRSGRPLPARLRLDARACWFWLSAKYYATHSLVLRLRAFLVEAMIVVLACAVMHIPVLLTTFVLAVAFARPSLRTMRRFARDQVDWRNVAAEIRFQSLAFSGGRAPPHHEANALTSTVPALSAPTQATVSVLSHSAARLQWKPPAAIPAVHTESGRVIPVGVSRYQIRLTFARTGHTVTSHSVPVATRDWWRHPSWKELACFLCTIVGPFAEPRYISPHSGLAASLFLVLGFALTRETSPPYRPQSFVLSELEANTEYAVFVAGVDELDRVGDDTFAVQFTTKPFTLVRRVLMVAEETEEEAPAPVGLVGPLEPSPKLPPRPPPPPKQVHIRYAGVVWNVAMDYKESDLFLRTMRSACLRQPRKETFEADIVFSTEMKFVHQVVTPSFLMDMANRKPRAWMRGWLDDPVLIAHPWGTRHMFGKTTIYQHIPLVKPNHVDWAVGFFLAGLVLSYARTCQVALQTGDVHTVLSEVFAQVTLAGLQTHLLSNAMVILLKNFPAAKWSQQVKGTVETVLQQQATRALDSATDPGATVERTAIVLLTALVFCSIALLGFGMFSFSGLSISALIIWTSSLVVPSPGNVLPAFRMQVRENVHAALRPARSWLPGFVREVGLVYGVLGAVVLLVWAAPLGQALFVKIPVSLLLIGLTRLFLT